MSNNSLDKIAKKLYRYIKTKEGEIPDMNDEETQRALHYIFNKGYLIKKECCSPETTPEGEEWYIKK